MDTILIQGSIPVERNKYKNFLLKSSMSNYISTLKLSLKKYKWCF